MSQNVLKTSDNAPRADTLRKLLALGPLHLSEIHDAMGGNREFTLDALEALILAGHAYQGHDTNCVKVYRLTNTARDSAFAKELTC